MTRMTRRGWILTSFGGALAMAGPAGRNDAGGKDFRGVFPILQTPYLESGPVDNAVLAEEVRFAARCGVPGVVWPQLASEYASLETAERMKGADAVVEAAKGAKVLSVIGVQAATVDQAVAYAKHAAKTRPDAIIAIPLRPAKDQPEIPTAQQAAYYKAIAAACDLPLFVQAIGDMSVDFLLNLANEIPSLCCVKDEAGHTLSRLTEFRERDKSHRLGIFTGGHGKTLIDEMARGSQGNMPATGFVDLYVKAWNDWHAGREQQAMEAMARAALLVHEVSAYGISSLDYILYKRGVFKNWKSRQKGPDHLDQEARQALDRSLEFVKPYLVA